MDLYQPLKNPLSGQAAMLVARINLSYLANLIRTQSFNKIGQVDLINQQGQGLFNPSGENQAVVVTIAAQNAYLTINNMLYSFTVLWDFNPTLQ